MPVETTSGVPQKFYAGDLVRFTWGHSDYPASAWTATLALKNPQDLTASYATATGTADDDDHLFTLTSLVTTALRPGVYQYAIIVAETATPTEKVTAQTGTIRILPSVLSNAKGPRRTAYEAARTALEALAAKKFQSVSVEGETYTLQTVAELSSLVDRLLLEAMQEDADFGLPVAGGVRRIKYRM